MLLNISFRCIRRVLRAVRTIHDGSPPYAEILRVLSAEQPKRRTSSDVRRLYRVSMLYANRIPRKAKLNAENTPM